MMKRAYALMPSVARTAFGKVMLQSGHGTLPPQARNAARSFASSPRELRADRIELLQLPTDSTHGSVIGATHETLLEDEAFGGFASAAMTHVAEGARSADR